MRIKLLISLLIVFNAGLVSAMSSNNYTIPVSACNQGGGDRYSGQYRIDDAVGQGVIGDIKSNNYNLSIGLIPILLPQPVLTISSDPSGANIYLNNVDTGSVTTHTFTNLLLGTYTIRLTLSGYKDWSGTTTVTAGLTTSIDAILTPIAEGGYEFVWKQGSYGIGNGQFNYPRGVAVDSSGNVYVADSGTHSIIQKFNSDGVFITKWGGKENESGQFANPHGVAVDSSGNVYVADTVNHRIQKFNSNGSFITQWGSYGSGDGQLNAPYGIAVDLSGNVYVVDSNNNRIQKFNSSGMFITKWGSYGSGDGQFNHLFNIVIDSSGNIYVADYYNNRIQKFTSNGAFITKWGREGTESGQFKYPGGVAIDSSDNVYVVDTANHRIQKFTSNGIFITQWGRKGTESGQFNSPWGVDVDSSGNVYVADLLNYRIQKFRPITPSGNYISGRVTKPDGTPIAGVEIVAKLSEGYANYAHTDIAGNYTVIDLLPEATYTVTASCRTLEGFISGASILVMSGVCEVNFTLSIEYDLGSIGGKLIVTPTSLWAAPARHNLKNRVELWQLDKKLLSVGVDSEGNFQIPNLASGYYLLKVYADDSMIGEKRVVLHQGEHLMIELGAGHAQTSENQIYLYPNPTTSGEINIHLYSTHSQPEPNIRIYTLAGELVSKIDSAEIISKNITSPPDYTYKWDLTNSQGRKVASGVYLCLIEVRTGQGERVKVVKKLAVIR